MSNTGNRIPRAVAWSGVVLACAGVVCALVSAVAVAAGACTQLIEQNGIKTFYLDYLAMLTCSVCLSGAVLWCAVGLLRVGPAYSRRLRCVLVAELAYCGTLALVVGALRSPAGVEAALGVANIALGPQVVILYPVWGLFTLSLPALNREG